MVTAFVTREHDLDLQILVFHHPTTGLQLPAGTVDLGETPEQAVLRETAEETGLNQLRIIARVGELVTVLPGDQRIVLRMTKLFDNPTFDASSPGGFGLTRGTPVKVTGEVGKFTAVICDPLDQNQDPPVRISGVHGFVRSSLLGSRIGQHLFHLVTDEETSDSWSGETDGLKIKLYWTNLEPGIPLQAIQREWLESVIPVIS